MVGKVLIFQNDKCKNISAPSPCSQGCETGYSMALYCWMPGEKTSTLLSVSSRSQGSVLIIFSQNFKVAQRESSTLWTTDKKQFNLLLGLTLVVVETQHQPNLTELIVWHYYWLLTPTTIRSHLETTTSKFIEQFSWGRFPLSTPPLGLFKKINLLKIIKSKLFSH